METNFCVKLSIFRKIIKYVNNWYIILLVYYGLFKKEFYMLNLKNGLGLKLRTRSTDIQTFVNVWIIQEYSKDEFEINENDVVVDVGGHIGLFAVYASLFCKRGKILSFEPIKENYRLLLENIELNKIKNVKSFNLAVAAKVGKVKIYQHNHDQAAHTLYGNGQKYVQVDSITLKEIIDSNLIERCDLLKLDCEGAEYEILHSLPDDYFKRIIKICMEYHAIENSMVLLAELKNRLTRVGYKIMDVKYAENSGLLFAHR